VVVADQPPNAEAVVLAPEEPPDFDSPRVKAEIAPQNEIAKIELTSTGEPEDAAKAVATTPIKPESPEEKLQDPDLTKEEKGMAQPVEPAPPKQSFLASIPSRIAGSFTTAAIPCVPVLNAPTPPLPGTGTDTPTTSSASALDVPMGGNGGTDLPEVSPADADQSADSSAKRIRH
jgi:hypothetical protein